MFTVTSAKNPQYMSACGKTINLQIKCVEIPNKSLPLTVSAYAPESWIVDIYNDANSGKYGSVAPFVPPTLD